GRALWQLGGHLRRLCTPTGARFVGDPKRTQGLERVSQPSWKGIENKDRPTYTVDPDEDFPDECDALVIGGGAIGCSVAYWLSRQVNCNVVVVERDPAYTRAASPLSCGGIRQQFSEPENIQMSLFGSQFLRNIKENLAVFDLDPPDICYAPHGYLVLADEANAETLRTNNQAQRKLGAKVDLMSPEKMKETWPWLNVSDIALGAFGTENEGWFDPYLFLQALKRKAVSQNVKFVVGELLDFEFSMQRYVKGDLSFEQERLKAALVKCPDNLVRNINFGVVVNAAGPWAGHVAHLAGVGDFAGKVKLPVEPRRQSVFVVSLPPHAAKKAAAATPGIDAPFIQDVASGLHLRRDGFQGDFVTYVNPPPPLPVDQLSESAVPDEPECNGVDLEPDYDWFDKQVWPRLAHRVPCMEAVKVRNAWAGFYDYNTFDQNLVIGRHPFHENLIFCNGSSGHGIQHAVAIGRAVSELVLFRQYKTIDLSRMSFERLQTATRIRETGII
ncbi:hypothetical protein BOX15_Mlig001411g1, partial [Macrostomum lignano]